MEHLILKTLIYEICASDAYIPVKKLAYLVKDFMEIIKNQSNFDPSFLDIQGMVNTSFNEYEYYKKIGLLRSNTETEILVLNIMFGFNDIYLS